MKRLLSIVGSMNSGGTESFLMKFYRTIDKSKYQIDFAVMTPGKNFYEDEIVKLGGRMFRITPKSTSLIKNLKDVYSVTKKYNYEYVMRSGENAANVLELLAAKKAGARRLIFNSTSSKTGSDNLKENFVHRIFLPLVRTVPNVKIGCSTSTNLFMYGKRSVQANESFVFHNALDIDLYKFDQERRNAIRSQFGFSHNEKVFGHVGRFAKPKNHSFLFKIFKNILQLNPQSRLLIIGVNPNEENIYKMLNEDAELKRKTVIAGIRRDVPDCLLAMDAFVFPSIYEGLPNAVVEAQASGLPCIISNRISSEVKITDSVFFLPLETDPKEWAKMCVEKAGQRNDKAPEEMKNSGYDISETTLKLEQLIFE